MGLIDEYTFVVHPVVGGGGPRLLEGMGEEMALELVERWGFGSGVVVQRCRRNA
ncbi:dihydrofolate reductase family protein [uncultured Microbacterium sp.]|uniref:dihydrofolate reductase family protein n=1 Tax=uncultured Microbacterium sp. TaxID=191216 RepID=UPI0028D744D8|nr:dihydrofolate reductase family protein [uncultured Microbacterium sp.]